MNKYQELKSNFDNCENIVGASMPIFSKTQVKEKGIKIYTLHRDCADVKFTEEYYTKGICFRRIDVLKMKNVKIETYREDDSEVL